MGPEYGPAAAEVLRLLAITVLIGGALSIVVSTIMGINRHRAFVPVLAMEALCNISLSIALVGRLGLAGVAIGTLVPNVLVTVLVVPLALRWMTGIRVGAFYRDAWLLPIVACIPFTLATILMERNLPAANLLTFFAQVAVLLPLVPALALPVCMTQTERLQLAAAVRARIHQ